MLTGSPETVLIKSRYQKYYLTISDYIRRAEYLLNNHI